MTDLIPRHLRDAESAPAAGKVFAGARLDDDEVRDAAAQDERRRAQARARHDEETRSNLGLRNASAPRADPARRRQLRAVRSWRQRTAQLAEHFPAEERLRVMSALPATSNTPAQLVAMGF